MVIKTLLLLAVSLSAAHAGHDVVKIKLKERAEIMKMGRGHGLKSENNPYTPAYFLNLDINAMPTDMHFLQQFSGVDISESYWSGYYWPNYVGGLGFRYNDPRFPKGRYGKSRKYVRGKPSTTIPNNYLSPSEKYDVMMGISPEDARSLTTQQWSLGQQEYEETGKVETWQGICNGWAAAAIAFPTPQHPITFNSPRGPITFEKEDVKALGSLLWAAGKFESVFNGFRCFTDDPEHRGDRVTTPECFDINPADWHLIVTQHLGQNRRPFIIDYINSKEVWNKPLVGYQLEYFNVKSRGQRSADYSRVLAPNRKVKIFREFRNPNTVWVLGVRMTAKLLFGANEDSRVGQTFKTMEYQYLLELDEAHRIIGGEWLTEKHPDFAWMPRYAGLPATDGDGLTNALDVDAPTANALWRDGALAAIKHGSPIGRFVQRLFELAQ